MSRERLVMGLASVFAGITVVLVVGALASQPFLLFVAVPFAATTYFMWYHASGRLQAQTRTRRVRAPPGGFGRGRGAGPGNRFNSAGGFESVGGFDPGGSRRRANGPGGSAGSGPSRTIRTSSGPSRAEAYRTLGLEPDAGREAIRSAYRSKVKEVHPDTEGGDEEAFKRVNRAYELLSE
ncbi:MAG: J domain-containing protein [Halobacteriota archaeon]